MYVIWEYKSNGLVLFSAMHAICLIVLKRAYPGVRITFTVVAQTSLEQNWIGFGAVGFDGTSGSELLFLTLTILKLITGELTVVHVIVICGLLPNVILAVAESLLLLTSTVGVGIPLN